MARRADGEGIEIPTTSVQSKYGDAEGKKRHNNKGGPPDLAGYTLLFQRVPSEAPNKQVNKDIGSGSESGAEIVPTCPKK